MKWWQESWKNKEGELEVKRKWVDKTTKSNNKLTPTKSWDGKQRGNDKKHLKGEG